MKNMLKSLLILMAAVAICAVPGMNADAKVKVKKVTVKSNYGTMVHVAVGKKIKLTTTVKVTPNKAANKKVTYTTSKKKVATVSSSGYVKGVKAGSCKITVKSKKNKKKKATISVKVVKQVQKATLNQETATIYAGASTTLKATLTPTSGSYKKVTWSTSNKSVATVSTAGVVKGKAAGTATIKATSVEGSKKTASCKVKVLSADTISIGSVQVLSSDCVRVTLDKAKVLTKESFVVEGKKYATGTYTRVFKIEQVRNYDNKTYDITVDDTYSIANDSYIRVSIASLPGNGSKTCEAQAVFVKTGTPAAQNWIGTIGDKMSKVIDLSEYCYGNVTYTVTGSVGGLTYVPKENTLKFSGVLTTATVGTVLTVEATDELDNKVTQKINVYVGNDATVVSYAADLTMLTGETVTNMPFVEAVGGSGEYTYAATNMPSGLTLNEDGTLSGTVSGVAEYSVEVTVTDKNNATRVSKAPVTISVADKKLITGTVLDESGQGLKDVLVMCENVSDGTTFSGKTDESGVYKLYVAEGSYDVYAALDGEEDHVYNIAVTTGGRQIGFILSKYQVLIPFQLEGATSYKMTKNWTDSDNVTYNGVNSLMVDAGIYELSSEVEAYHDKELLGTYSVTVNFTVTAKGVTAVPVFTKK